MQNMSLGVVSSLNCPLISFDFLCPLYSDKEPMQFEVIKGALTCIHHERVFNAWLSVHIDRPVLHTSQKIIPWVARGTVMGGQHTHENVHSGRS